MQAPEVSCRAEDCRVTPTQPCWDIPQKEQVRVYQKQLCTFVSPSPDVPWFWVVYTVLVLHVLRQILQ